MKKILISIISIIISTWFVSASFTDIDKKEVYNKITTIEKAVNSSDADTILNLLSPNASEILKQEIQNNIAGKKINYQQNIWNMEEIDSDKIKLKWKFSAKGINWSVSGFSNYFIFEKINNGWYLQDSDFAEKLDPNKIFKMIGKFFLFIAPFFLLITWFWIWMIVDVSKRNLKDTTKRILILVFFNWLGAIIYYFTARREDIKRKKQDTVNDFIL